MASDLTGSVNQLAQLMQRHNEPPDVIEDAMGTVKAGAEHVSLLGPFRIYMRVHGKWSRWDAVPKAKGNA